MFDIAVGTTVTVTVHNTAWAHRHRYAYHVPKVLRYTGKVTATPKWAGDDLALTTGRIDFPVRMLARDSIISVDGQSVNSTVTAAVAQSWAVPGSKGSVHTVSYERGHWACTCAGFQFKKNCRHVNDKRDEVLAAC